MSKKGEKRVAITPDWVKKLTESGYKIIVQPRVHPQSGETKRAFIDNEYREAGAEVAENIEEARVVFGLKEIEIHRIQPEKVYFCFSHTHKGQVKNMKMLEAFKNRKTTLIDYELIVNEKNQRLITAFTYFAGYAGMIDTLWTVGKRLAMERHNNPFEKVPQSIRKEDLGAIREILKNVGEEIISNGTPAYLPPFINLILGTGKTSQGAQEIYDILPVENINPDQIKDTFENGSRKKVYKCVLDIEDMFRLNEDAGVSEDDYGAMSKQKKHQLYFEHPEYFESNLEKYLPYTTILMNCILWSPEFPRTITNQLIKRYWTQYKTLKAIGDITCDPNGSIEFSKETWIDNPVYIYNPTSGSKNDGFEGAGIAVMAVTNLPCEFSADASAQFAEDLSGFLEGIANADYSHSIEKSGLPEPIRRAVILWNGEFTKEYAYMETFLPEHV